VLLPGRIADAGAGRSLPALQPFALPSRGGGASAFVFLEAASGAAAVLGRQPRCSVDPSLMGPSAALCIRGLPLAPPLRALAGGLWEEPGFRPSSFRCSCRNGLGFRRLLAPGAGRSPCWRGWAGPWGGGLAMCGIAGLLLPTRPGLRRARNWRRPSIRPLPTAAPTTPGHWQRERHHPVPPAPGNPGTSHPAATSRWLRLRRLTLRVQAEIYQPARGLRADS